MQWSKFYFRFTSGIPSAQVYDLHFTQIQSFFWSGENKNYKFKKIWGQLGQNSPKKTIFSSTSALNWLISFKKKIKFQLKMYFFYQNRF